MPASPLTADPAAGLHANLTAITGGFVPKLPPAPKVVKPAGPNLTKITGGFTPKVPADPAAALHATLSTPAGPKLYDLPGGGKTAFPPTSSEYQDAVLANAEAGKVTPKVVESPAYKSGQEAGLLPSSAVLSGGTLAAKALNQIAGAAAYAPAGIYDAGKAVGTDLYNGLQHQDFSAKNTRTLGGTMIHQTAQSFEHPKEDPGYLLMNLLGGAGAVAGVGGRLAAAADALRGGSGFGAAGVAGDVRDFAAPETIGGRVAAALVRPTYKGGSLLHQMPPIPRTFQVGGETANLLPSRNLAWRGAQAVYDAVGKHALATNPGGKMAGRLTAKLGKSMDESALVRSALQSVPAAEMQAAAKPLTGARVLPHTRAENLAAIRLTAKNVTPEDQLRFHQAHMDDAIQNGKPDIAANHAKQIKIMQGVIDRGLVGTDEAGNAVAGPAIAKAEALHHEVGNLGTDIITGHGLMTPEGVRTRLDAPGKVVAGAEYEKPTPGKLGVESPALVRQRAHVARLEQLHERAMSQAAAKATPFPNVHTRPSGTEVAPGVKTPGAPSDMVPTGTTSPITERLGGALSVARDQLARMEAAAASRVKPTGFVGAESALPGRTFVSDKQIAPKTAGGMFGRAQGPVVGKAKSPLSPHHAYTGGAEHAGVPPANPIKDMATHYRQLVRYANTTEFRQLRARMGSDAKATDRDVLVSDQKHSGTIPPETRVALGQAERTTDIAHAATLQDRLHELLPGLGDKFAADEKAAIGHPAPKGYKWVDRNLLGDLAKPQGRLEDVIGKHPTNAIDAINNGMKTAYVYVKLGHFATRYGTNAVLNILHGSATPLGVARTARLVHTLNDRETLQMAAIGGQGYVHAVFDPAEARGRISGAIGKAAGAGTKFWGHQDTPFRVNAVAYEMRKAGFDTAAKVKDLLANPDKYRAQIDDIGKRANRENIAYDNLTGRQKQVVSRMLWFFPWIKGSTQYAGRLLYEHPLKAAVLSSLGEQGQNQAYKDLGPVPSTETGLMKVGGSKAFPEVSLPNTLNPLSTPSEIARDTLGLAGGQYGTEAARLAQNLSPAVSTLEAVTNKTDQYGGAEPSASLTKILKQQVLGSAPEALLFNRLRDLGYLKGLGVNPTVPKVVGQIAQALKAGVITKAEAASLVTAVKNTPSKKMFPLSANEAIGMPVAGSWWPRTANDETLNAQAEKEMTPAAKLHFELQRAVQDKVITPAQVKQLAGVGR